MPTNGGIRIEVTHADLMQKLQLLAPSTEYTAQTFCQEETLKFPKYATESPIQLAKFLTLLSDERLLFIPWHHESHRQDIIVAVNSNSEEIAKWGNQDRSVLPSRFHFMEGNELKNIIYCSDISLVCLVASDIEYFCDDADQLGRYLFNVLRHHPYLTTVSGILTYKNTFYIARIGPNVNNLSEPYQWEDERALTTLRGILREQPNALEQFEMRAPDGPVHTSLMKHYSRFQYSSGIDKKYQLYNLPRHDLAVHVAIGIQTSALPWPTRDDCLVVKSRWKHEECYSNELCAFQNIFNNSSEGPVKKCTAGLVRPDVNLSPIPGKNDGHATQENVIALKTVGDTLADCKSVKDFLMAMYDLVEVHRMLVEEHGILHCNINWSNVLINVFHLDGSNHDDFCRRPFIDAVLGISEQKRRVHVAISDFSSASFMHDLNNNSEQTRKFSKRVPFMASALCWCTPQFRCYLSIAAFRNVYEAIFGRPGEAADVFERNKARSREVILSHSDVFERDKARSREVVLFHSDVLELQKFSVEYSLSRGEKREAFEERIQLTHMPHHDAESIFWVIVFFFIRACPADYRPETDEGEQKRRFHRTALFKSMLRNAICEPSNREIPDPAILPPQLGRFHQMLVWLQTYFKLPWLSLVEKDHLPHQLFHGHNVLQCFLLREIKALEESGDDVLLRREPLDIYASSFTLPRPETCLTMESETGGEASEAQVPIEATSAELSQSERNPGSGDEPPTSDCIAERLHSALDSSAQCSLWYTGKVPQLVW